MVHVTGFVIGKHLSQYPIEFDSIQEEVGLRVLLLSTEELQNCSWIEGARMGCLGRSRGLKFHISIHIPGEKMTTGVRTG
jgi:hypothetical protein